MNLTYQLFKIQLLQGLKFLFVFSFSFFSYLEKSCNCFERFNSYFSSPIQFDWEWTFKKYWVEADCFEKVNFIKQISAPVKMEFLKSKDCHWLPLSGLFYANNFRFIDFCIKIISLSSTSMEFTLNLMNFK